MGRRSKQARHQAIWGGGLSIGPRKAVSYSVRLDGGSRHRGRGSRPSWFESTDTGGQVSRVAAGKIENAVQWLVMAARWKSVYSKELGKVVRFKVNMITLTLPSQQQHSDQVIKAKCLNQFLVEAKKSWGLGEYIWRAESQSNGNIHFHIITSTFIEPFQLRTVWNRVVGKLGYIDRFEQTHGHREPNSTDVHSIKHVRNVGSYLAKYVSKGRRWAKVGELRQVDGQLVEVLFGSDEYRSEEADNKAGRVVGSVIAGPLRGVEGRLWYASKGLQGGGKVSIDEHHQEFRQVYEVVKSAAVRYKHVDFATIYWGPIAEAVMWQGGEVGQMLRAKKSAAAGVLTTEVGN